MHQKRESHPEVESAWSQLPTNHERIKGRDAVRRYLEGVGDQALGELCVLYLSNALDLLGAARWCGLNAPQLHQESGTIFHHGEVLGAAGFIIARTVHGKVYHPDPRTVSAISKLRRVSAELDIPMLDYLIFTSTQTLSVGGP
jgi:hypothetical protein